MKRHVALALLVTAGVAQTAISQDRFPSRAVQVVVTSPAGTASDFIGRTLGDKLSQRMGQPVVVQNRTGAGGAIASEFVAKAPPDGYTVLLVNSSHSTNPLLNPNLPYDTFRDFASILKFAEAPSVFVVHPKLGVRSVREFIALAKQKPGTIHYGTSGIGTITHFAGASFAASAGVDIVAVPYKGSEIMADLIAGRIDALFAPVPALLQLIREGKLVGLAVTSRTPMHAPLEIGTVDGNGLPGYEYATYYGFVAPAKTPRAILDQLGREIVQATQDKDVRDKFAAQAIFPSYLGPAEFEALIRSELDKNAALMKSLGSKVN